MQSLMCAIPLSILYGFAVTEKVAAHILKHTHTLAVILPLQMSYLVFVYNFPHAVWRVSVLNK